MSYTFLLAAGEESSAECFSDIPACVLSRLSLTGAVLSSNGSGTESCPTSPSGMMCEPLTPDRGEDVSMLSAEAFRVSDTPTSEKCTAALALMDGQTPPGLSETQPPLSYFWKTSQQFFGGIGGESLGNCPTWGMTLDGACFQRAPLVIHTHGRGCSYWRTPAASDWKRRNLDWESVRKLGNPLCLPQQVAQKGFHGYLNPQFLASLMDWPDTWAKLQPLEMAKFQAWFDSHGGF